MKKKKTKAPKAVSKKLNKFDRKSGKIIKAACGTVRRFKQSVVRLDRRLTRFGDDMEKLYDTQSKAGL